MSRRRGWSSALLVFVCALGGRALAQARPTATGPGMSVRAGGGVSGFQADYGQRVIGGETAWVDANPRWRFGFEGEARWLRMHSDTGTRQTTYLAGPRIVILPGRIEPYAKGLAGVGLFTFPYGYGHGSYFVFGAGGGVDLHLGRGWQFRAVDVEYQTWPQLTFGSLHPHGVSTGVSYTLYGGPDHARHLRR